MRTGLALLLGVAPAAAILGLMLSGQTDAFAEGSGVGTAHPAPKVDVVKAARPVSQELAEAARPSPAATPAQPVVSAAQPLPAQTIGEATMRQLSAIMRPEELQLAANDRAREARPALPKTAARPAKKGKKHAKKRGHRSTHPAKHPAAKRHVLSGARAEHHPLAPMHSEPGAAPYENHDYRAPETIAADPYLGLHHSIRVPKAAAKPIWKNRIRSGPRAE